MDPKVVLALVSSLAEQQYQFVLLTRLLTKKGILHPGELESQWNDAEKAEFDLDFRRHLGI